MLNIISNYFYNIGVEALKKREDNVLKLMETNSKADYLECGPGDGSIA